MTERLLDTAINRQHNLEQLAKESAGEKKLDDMAWFFLPHGGCYYMERKLIRAKPYEFEEIPIFESVKKMYYRMKDAWYKISGW